MKQITKNSKHSSTSKTVVLSLRFMVLAVATTLFSIRSCEAFQPRTSRIPYEHRSTTSRLGSTPLPTATPEDLEQVMTATSNLMMIFQHTSSNPLFSEPWWTDLATDAAIVYGTLPGWAGPATIVLPLVHMLAAVGYRLSHPPDGYRNGHEPYTRGNYDSAAAKEYYTQHHPLLVVQRCLEIVRLAQPFCWNWLLDTYVWRKQKDTTSIQQQQRRAQELTTLVQQLGPAAIKVGQAMSVRSDLIPQVYADSLAQLQDQVPPFCSRLAQQVLREQLGPDKYALVVCSTTESNNNNNEKALQQPIASASIGQVYRLTLADGRTVAVKIQRPTVLSEIALDLFIGQELAAPLYERFFQAASDCQAIAQEWGRGFVSELDYCQEAYHTTQFNKDMRRRGMDGVVCAPTVVDSLVTHQVLVTEWVDGTRLDDASSVDDIPRLCSVALNAYMVMLLETSKLHCDPHPGNLMRTRDGRLCILDFGMVLDIDPNLQYSLLEFVAHLTSNNYDTLPQDLVKLGFLAPNQVDFAVRSGILEPMKYFLEQAGQGGGASGVRDRIVADYRSKYPGLSDDELQNALRSEMEQQMQQVMDNESVATGIQMQMDELQRVHRDAFTMPDWFLYSSRAFLTLEGVSLQSDGEYSLIKSCFPYIAKRLVGDDDPRAKNALKSLLYGTTGTIDVKKLTDLAGGFSSFTATSKNSVSNDKEQKLTEAEATITLAKDSADVLFAPEGNFVQNMLVEETSLAASATFKDAVRETLVEGPQRLRAVLPFGFVLPPLPFEDQVAPFVQKSEKEQKAQELADSMVKMLPDSTESEVLKTLTDMDPEQAALVLRELRQNLPKYGPMLAGVGGKLVSTLLSTASESIDTTLQQLERTSELNRPIVRAAIKGVSNVAQQGANAINKQKAKKKRPQ